MNKKAIYHTLDALLAGMLLVATALLLLKSPFYEPDTQQKSFLSEDLLNSISELKINEIDSEFITSEINSSSITNENISVLEQIGEYWALNKTDKATTLLEIVINNTFDENMGLRVSIEGDEIYKKDYPSDNTVVTNTRMITGIAKGAPLKGFSSSAYLKRVRNKKTSAYAYMGGFIGQGNLSILTEKLPNDINDTKITSILLEGDFNGNFSLKINNQICNSTNNSETFYTTTGIGEIDAWDISRCNNSITSGKNNFTIKFEAPIENSFVAGGLVEIEYRTDELQQNLTYGQGLYNFPGVEGVANIYDSFYVPGDLQSMNIGLHFKSSQQTYLTIGERIIEINSTGVNQWEHYDNSYLLNNLSLDYNLLSRNTIPLRFAAYNATVEEVVAGNADVIIITDFSGSMKKAVGSWSQGTGLTDCEELYTYEDARKTHLARCLDNEVVDIIMNYSGNKMWPVFIHSDKIDSYNNPTDKDAIGGYISGYGPQGKDKTCLACAINEAYDYLDQYSSPDRKKFIILMSDGAPTHCADGSCTSTSSNFGTEICVGFCDTNGASGCSESDKVGCDLTDTSCSDAEDNTIFSVNRTFNDLNATFYTVGFGLIEDCSRAANLLKDIANMTNGTYQHSTNVSELKLIYENISYEILDKIIQVNQSVSVQGNLTNSDLYQDSFINYTYVPIADPADPGKISLVIKAPLTSCNSTINIPEGVEIIDSKVISYSGTQWADLLVVNSETIFNLSNYYVPYYKLGDPLVIQIPVDKLDTGDNTIFIETGDSPTNRTSCSANNSIIYSALINASTPRTNTLDILEGCKWTIESENGNIENITIPTGYSGLNTCSYTSTLESYNPLDAYDYAAYQLFTQLDPDSNGKIIVDLSANDLEITLTVISNIPYLWGPSLMKTEVWS